MEIVCLPRAVKFGNKNGVGGAAFLSISRCHLLHREPDYDYVYIFRACVYLCCMCASVAFVMMFPACASDVC